ncbi:hypothetical protein RIF29_21070 [Crotalaria pallida]|uniref:Uncharacterized protein n=1 Tax=Crotalaria pallida TaxID=3830 RepID=A0AAN9I6W2_CROPI
MYLEYSVFLSQPAFKAAQQTQDGGHEEIEALYVEIQHPRKVTTHNSQTLYLLSSTTAAAAAAASSTRTVVPSHQHATPAKDSPTFIFYISDSLLHGSTLVFL